jgi:hypothetical protein
MNKLCFTLFFLGLSIQAATQNKITGKVIAADHENIIYQIRVEYTGSSRSMTGNFYIPDFEITTDSIGEVRLTVSSNGYESYQTQKALQSSAIDLGEITLFKRSVQLGEVVVSAPKINIKQDGMDYTIRNIQGTYLGDAGNLVDMLKWTPGIMVQNDNAISVVGKGSPIIYIDGRKMANKSELLALQSSDVSRIEIIREPDARYKNGTNAVIGIYMKKQLKDFIGINVSNTASVNRLFRNRSSLDMNWKSGILSGNTSFAYSRDNGKDYETSGTNIYSGNTPIFSSSSDKRTESHRNVYNVFTGLNFALNGKSNLRMQYVGDFDDEKVDGRTGQQNTDMKTGTTEEKQISAAKPNNNKTHSASVSYQLERNEDSSLNLVADYANADKKYDETLQENNLTDNYTNRTIKSNRGNYKTYTFSGDYSFMTGKNEYETVGISSGIVNSNSTTITNRVSQSTDIDNKYFNAYATYQKKWKKVNVTLGLRYEYDYMNTRLIETENPEKVKKEYSDLFPDVKVSYSFKNRNKLSFKYSRLIFRPAFYELNPVIYYEDSLHYYVGNPALHPSYSNSYSLTFNVKKITMNLIYRHRKDAIRSSYVQDFSDPFVTVETPENIGKSDSWEFNTIYNYFKKGFNFYGMGQLFYAKSSFPYLGENVSESKLNAMLYWTASYTLKKEWNLFTNGWYSSPKLMNGEHVGYALCFNVGVSTNFFKKKLNASLSVNDIFNKMVTPTYMTIHSNNTDYWRRNKYDSRGVSLTLRYTFNSVKTKFEKVRGNEGTLERATEEAR